MKVYWDWIQVILWGTFIAYIDIPQSEVGYTGRIHPQDFWTKSNHPIILHKSQKWWKHPWNSQNETEISEFFFSQIGDLKGGGPQVIHWNCGKLSLRIVSTLYFGIGYIFDKYNIKSRCCISTYIYAHMPHPQINQNESFYDIWTNGAAWLQFRIPPVERERSYSTRLNCQGFEKNQIETTRDV